MPYKTRKVGNEYCVYKKDGGKKVGCTKGTEEAKKKYLAALHSAEDEECEDFDDVAGEILSSIHLDTEMLNDEDEEDHKPRNPGILKRRIKGKITCSKARSLKSSMKNKGSDTAKAAQRFINYHCDEEDAESTSKAPKGKSYDSQNNWKPSSVDARSDGAGGRYRRTRPNKPGRSSKTHGESEEMPEEDAEKKKKVSKLRQKCQAKAKRKYDVWPSAYASGYVQKCVNRKGNIK